MFPYRSRSYDQAEMTSRLSQLTESKRVTSIKTPTSVVHVEVNHRRANSHNASLEIETIDEVREMTSERVMSPQQSHKMILTRRHSSNEPSFGKASDLDMLMLTLELRKRQLGPQNYKVGEVYNLIGNIHFRCRRYQQAIEAYKLTLHCDRGALDTTPSAAAQAAAPIAAALGNLGAAYWTIGDLDKSLEHLEHAMSVYAFIDQAQGKDPMRSLNVAGCLYQMGCAECLRRNYKQSLEHLTLCLEIQEAVLGTAHVDVARTVDVIGKAQLGLGNTEEALHHHMDALVMKKQWAASFNSSDDAGILVSLQNIAAVHRAREEYSEAISMYQKVALAQKSELATLKRGRPGKASPDVVRLALETGDTLLTLKELYWLKGDTAASAMQGKEAALFFREAGLKDDDGRLIACRTRGIGMWNSV